MSYQIEIEYEVIFENLPKTLYLNPDQAISYQFGKSFNWIGTAYIKGENIEIKIPQTNIYEDPKIQDVIIDKRIIIDKEDIIRKIKEKLNFNMS